MAASDAWIEVNANGDILVDTDTLKTQKYVIKYTSGQNSGQTNPFIVKVECGAVTYTAGALVDKSGIPPDTSSVALIEFLPNNYLAPFNAAPACAPTYSLHEVDASNNVSPTAVPASDTWIAVAATGAIMVDTDTVGEKTYVVKYASGQITG